MIAVTAALLLACAGCGGSAIRFSDAQPTEGVFVKAHGRNLELGRETFIFRGVNIWGAASDQSVYDCGAEDPDQTAYLNRTLRGLSALGVNVVRFFAFQSYAGGGTDLTAIRRVIDAARSYNIRVIPVLGNQFADCDYYPSYAKNLSFSKSTDWYETGYKAPNSGYALSYRDYVRMIVSAFKDDPAILTWQLMNEAQVSDLSDADGSILRDFATDVSGLIKSIDPNHLVSVGTHGTGQPGTQGPSNRALHEISTVDVVEGHDYGADTDPLPGYPDSRWNSIWGAMTDAVELDKPFFIDEAGIMAGDDAACPHSLAERAKLLASKARAMFREGGVGYLYWSYAERINPQDNNCGYDMKLDDPALTGLRSILS
jgi:mannan endo-1,4-beta-mannosidase